MLSEKDLREIRMLEDAGFDVVSIGRGGTLEYATQNKGTTIEYCDQCNSFKLFPDPAPDDWFRNGDWKAVCIRVNGVIRGSLELPSECKNICKPLYCPILGRELSKEEKEEASKTLDFARAMMRR